jgi:HK97 family phage portal protein
MGSFVVTDGVISAVDRPRPIAAPRVQVTNSLMLDYATIWRTQPQVRTVVSFLGRNIAQLGLHTFQRMSDDDRRRLRDHPLAVLLAKPNPRTTRYRFFDALVQDCAIFDNALWLKSNAGTAQPKALLRLPPGQVTPIGENWLYADGYRLKGTKGQKDLKPEDVVHFRGYNPEDARWGVSPMETLRRILAEEYHAGTYREQLWRNGARFPGYIKRPANAPAWSDPARERFKNDWRGLYTGDGPGAGGTPILEDDMTFEASGVTPEQAQYLETRKLTREEVAAAFHIPLPFVGILDHATFSNIAEQHKNLYQDTLGPWLQMIQEEIELQLLPDFADTAGVYVEFNLAEKLRGSFEDQAQQLQSATGAPYMLRSEARARLNLPSVAGMDQPVIPLNVLIGGQASPTDSAPKHRTSKAAKPAGVKARADAIHETRYLDALVAYFTSQSDEVLAALGGGQSVTEAWDTERWRSELTTILYRLNASTSLAAATMVLDALGLDAADYDQEMTLAWLLKNAEGVADGINGTTLTQLEDAETSDDPEAARMAVFAVAIGARAASIATSQTSAISGFASEEAVKQQDIPATKTWITGSNPRSSHSSLDGETVDVGELFSNGARWPGDSKLHPDERVGCNCEMNIFVKGDT